MVTIHRFVINEAVNEIDMPRCARILSVGVCEEPRKRPFMPPKMKEVISIWAEVDDSAPMEKRKFLVFGTGANLEDTINFKTTFLGTVRKSNNYAFHVFEVEDKTNI